jgi:ferric-dicitrate binding protein FerR (iron transport regulator)
MRKLLAFLVATLRIEPPINATVRGTSWTMEDRCDGTLTKVKTGSVKVRDFTLRKTRVVKAGHSYLARAR